jgi:hypothetical protein
MTLLALFACADSGRTTLDTAPDDTAPAGPPTAVVAGEVLGVPDSSPRRHGSRRGGAVGRHGWRVHARVAVLGLLDGGEVGGRHQ